MACKRRRWRGPKPGAFLHACRVPVVVAFKKAASGALEPSVGRSLNPSVSRPCAWSATSAAVWAGSRRRSVGRLLKAALGGRRRSRGARRAGLDTPAGIAAPTRADCGGRPPAAPLPMSPPNIARSRRRWRGPEPGRFLPRRRVPLRASIYRKLPAAPLKPALGCPQPVTPRRTAGQPGIPGSRHTGPPGIPGSRAYRRRAYRAPDRRTYRAAGPPDIPGSRAAGQTGQPDRRTYRAAGHTGQPYIPDRRTYRAAGPPDIPDRRRFRIPTPAAQHRSQQTPLARPTTWALCCAPPACRRAPRSMEPASGAAEAGRWAVPQPERGPGMRVACRQRRGVWAGSRRRSVGRSVQAALGGRHRVRARGGQAR